MREMNIMLKHVAGWLAILVLSAVNLEAARDLRVIEAVRSQNHEAVRGLIRERADVNVAQADGTTALHWAAYRDDLAAAELLIGAGAFVNAVNDLGVAALYLACENGSAALVERLLKAGASPNSALASGETALMSAARAGNVEAVKALIASGADSNLREKTDGQTALMWAASRKYPDVVKLLVDAGADIHARSSVRRTVIAHSTSTRRGGVATVEEGGFTALLFAARQGDVASVRLLLAAGADVNDTAPLGTSALVVAAHSGHGPLARVLLDSGADANAAGAGYTALHAAVLRGDPELVRALLAHDADPNARLTKGTRVRRQSKDFVMDAALVGATPFFLAAKYAEAGIMRVLAAAGADPLAGLPDGTTPLMVAAGMRSLGIVRAGGDRRDREMDAAEIDLAQSQDDDVRTAMGSGIEAVKLAIELGADVNAVTQAGNTALHSAALHGFETVIRHLFEHGARLQVKNKRGQTPMMVANRDGMAQWRDNKNPAALLRQLGANE